ncbi:MAG: mandelate racemase/muconate lactonizing enzyme family protein [Geminicoccaceae bacterium]|nr:mandelate racemase/muconate lactonizing enzyme family protein [Geminicoccaceae bacterium]
MTIAAIELFYLRAPIDEPVVSSIGRFTARQSLLVRLGAEDGAHGWGEIWCNFPEWGGAHRARLVEQTLGAWYLGRPSDDPPALWAAARTAFHRIMIQSGEWGPVHQCMAGIDCALWDLVARRRGLPLAAVLAGDTPDPARRTLPAYASGINPGDPVAQMQRAREAGYRAFKLKLGFERDDRNLDAMTAALGPGELLMVDVNQGYDTPTARARLPRLAERGVAWIEEPIAADAPIDDWRALAALSAVPLAGGENLTDEKAFELMGAEAIFGIVQPDVAKWGGLSAGLRIARRALAQGRRYCPHYLGGAVGLLHSAHLLAAAGGDGLLEIDCNPNPLREELLDLAPLDREGRFVLSDAPGSGPEPDAATLERFTESHFTVR